MEEQRSPEQEIVRPAWEHADFGGNDRRTRVIYAAGFFDGEGWVSISTRGKRGQPALRIGAGQLVKAPLELLASLWGGAIVQDKKGMYRWHITSARADGALSELIPFLIVKREQAEIGREYYSQRAPRPTRWADAKERGRELQRQYRLRLKGIAVEKLPRPTIDESVYVRALEFKARIEAARP